MEEYGANKKARRRTAEPAGRTGPRAYARRPAGNNLERRFPGRNKNINDIPEKSRGAGREEGLLLRSIVDRIVYEKSSGTMYLTFCFLIFHPEKPANPHKYWLFWLIIWY